MSTFKSLSLSDSVVYLQRSHISISQQTLNVLFVKSDCEIILLALGRIDFDLPFLIGSVSINVATLPCEMLMPEERFVLFLTNAVESKFSIGNESVPKIIINDPIKIFLKLQSSFS